MALPRVKKKINKSLIVKNVTNFLEMIKGRILKKKKEEFSKKMLNSETSVRAKLRNKLVLLQR